MITRMSHVTIFVTNQDEALAFYRDKLGFTVKMDAAMEQGFRWLTLNPPEQPDLEVILMAVKPGMLYDEETAATLRQLVQKGVLGAGVMEVDDCKKTYEDLKAKGVEFTSPPTERFYGIEAIMKDNSGNWFSMTERKNA